jgi:hypothetical protein
MRSAPLHHPLRCLAMATPKEPLAERVLCRGACWDFRPGHSRRDRRCPPRCHSSRRSEVWKCRHCSARASWACSTWRLPESVRFYSIPILSKKRTLPYLKIGWGLPCRACISSKPMQQAQEARRCHWPASAPAQHSLSKRRRPVCSAEHAEQPARPFFVTATAAGPAPAAAADAADAADAEDATESNHVCGCGCERRSIDAARGPPRGLPVGQVDVHGCSKGPFQRAATCMCFSGHAPRNAHGR